MTTQPIAWDATRLTPDERRQHRLGGGLMGAVFAPSLETAVRKKLAEVVMPLLEALANGAVCPIHVRQEPESDCEDCRVLLYANALVEAWEKEAHDD